MNHPIRVRGHAIAEAGRAHDADGVLKPRPPLGAGQGGRCRCSCGALSEQLPSTLARTQWHRRHREELARVPWL